MMSEDNGTHELDYIDLEFEDGVSARNWNKPFHACPHGDGEPQKRRSWLAGWIDQDHVLEISSE